MRQKMASVRRLRFALLGLCGAAFWLGAGVMASPVHAKTAADTPPPAQHKTKSRPARHAVTLTRLATAPSQASRRDPVSPYERAAAQRTQSGEPPPGHPVVHPKLQPALPPRN